MRNILENYFYYSKSERNGVIFLTALTLGILIVPKIISIYYKPAKAIDYRAFEPEILAYHKSLADEDFEDKQGVQRSESILFTFDPNTASKDDFIRLGLSAKIATTISHYREKGGHFYKKEDLKKIYGMNSDDYSRLENYISLDENTKIATNDNYRTPQYETPGEVKLMPFDPNSATEIELLTIGLDKNTVKNVLKYREKGGKFFMKEDLKRIYGFTDLDFLRLEKFIQITDNQTNKNYSVTNERKNEQKNESINTPLFIDVNQATYEEWLQLRGIGRTFAARIIQHREKLGGFISLDQLKEIYGLPDSTFRSITPYLKFSAPIYRKISINQPNLQTILHPYLTRKQVDVLVRYRMNHGNFNNMEDLIKTNIFSKEMVEKIRPYIDFE